MADSPVGAANAGSAAASVPLASALAGGPISFINADVALDGEPVVGSFTADGLTFAVTEGSNVELVGVSETAGALSRRIVAESQGLAAPDAPTDLGAASAASETEADDAVLVLPESVAFEGIDYALTSIAPYAFYLSGVTSVELPASITDIDDRAFRSSDVSSVEVDPSNEAYASFDGILYDADHSSLLLIPGGRTGAARISSKAEEVDAAAFSHCAGVTAISVDAGSDHLSSWDGLLYDADGTTLLRVPAGATDITIREGCTTIAAGALEGCASLATINAPASVTSISPDVFTSVPTVSLPAASAVTGSALGVVDGADCLASEDPDPANAQLTALVALSSIDDELPKVDSASIKVNLAKDVDVRVWEEMSFAIVEGNDDRLPLEAMGEEPIGSLQSANAYAGRVIVFEPNGGTIYTNTVTVSTGQEKVTSTSAPTASNSWDAFSQVATADGSLRVETDARNPSRTSYIYTYATYKNIKAIAMGVSKDGPELTWAQMAAGTAGRYYFLYPTVKVTLDQQGGSNGTTLVTPRVANVVPNITIPSRTGYTFQGYYAASGGKGTKYYNADGRSQYVWDTVTVTKLYAYWTLNTYTITFDSAGGTPVSSIKAAYNEELTLPMPSLQGYAFTGWKDEATDTIYEAGKVKNLTMTNDATVKLVAQWRPVISADVPRDVTARVDLLGIEKPEGASGYIESRCGVPLRVAEVEFMPLSGARELFGDDVSQVHIEAYTDGGSTLVFSFKLGAQAFLSGGGLLALDMASYGTRVPISYRFDIPDELLPSLVEATKPVCSVAYTVALA